MIQRKLRMDGPRTHRRAESVPRLTRLRLVILTFGVEQRGALPCLSLARWHMINIMPEHVRTWITALSTDGSMARCRARSAVLGGRCRTAVTVGQAGRL
jgi:hypothetical protein